MAPKKSVQLSGVVVAESSISSIDAERGALMYRGYDISDLAEHATYEEVAYLLIEGDLPDGEQLAAFREECLQCRPIFFLNGLDLVLLLLRETEHFGHVLEALFGAEAATGAAGTAGPLAALGALRALACGFILGKSEGRNGEKRRGCDAQPLDLASDADRETLLACTWPDQAERFAQLEAALSVAAEDPVAIDRAPAAEWLERRLVEPRPGVATVVFQSLVLQYLDDDQRSRVRAAIEAAGAAATARAPLAWLRMEPGGDLADVRLRTWPGGEGVLIARAGYHGRPVRWLGGA